MSQKSLIHLLGLREYFDPKENKIKKKHAFFTEGWRVSSLRELFLNIDEYIEMIPEAERVNMYYTAANCFEKPGRHMDYQHILPIDVDGIDRDKYKDYIPVICEAIKIDYAKTGIVFTGNGLQFIIGLDDPIDHPSYFEDNRIYYKALCDRIQDALNASGLVGDVDTSVFSPARLLRLPNTLNSKPDKGEHKAFLIQNNIELVEFDLIERSGIPLVDMTQQISPAMLAHLPPPDTKGVTAGCDFLKYCNENQATISEPQWYAMLSILGRLENAREIVHAYSQGHASYSPVETDRKMLQAIETAGPRTCDNINAIWDGCASCTNWGNCKSPITLQSETYIKTKDTGFYNTQITPQGDVKKTKPNFSDLRMWFEQTHPYITMEDSGNVYLWQDNFWGDIGIKYLDAFAEEWLNPDPNNTHCNEFRGKIQRTNLRTAKWFEIEGLVNFKNGVLNLDTLELQPTSQENGFKYALPFAYDPDQKAPRFEQFLDEITLKDATLKRVLLQYMGYSLSGMSCDLGGQALILSGDGSNGKSVFMDVIKYLAGDGNYTTLSMGREINKPENRYQLDGKLFNISEETPTNAMIDNSVFKALVTGGEVQARKLYCDAYSMKNKAKIIMACNELPSTQDLTFGMMRRLLIAPFNATFTKHRDGFDPFIRDKLYSEASGIYNLVISALQEFIKNRGFSESETVDQEVERYRNQNDSVAMFIESRIIRDNKASTPFSDFYRIYKMDCESDGTKPENHIKFSLRLKKQLFDLQTEKRRVSGQKVTVYIGYRLASKEDDDAIQTETISPST